MKLNEKVYWCRKQTGLSQEELAARIGVSRQSISKWETGDASPEISKLPLLAQTFGVTTDWLLSDEGIPQEEPKEELKEENSGGSSWPDWVENLPDFLGKAIKKFGWIYGVRMAFSGGLFTLFGFVMRAISHSFFQDDFGISSDVTWYDSAGNIVSAPGNAADILQSMDFGGSGITSGFDSITTSATSSFDMMSGLVIFIGLAMLAAGIVIALLLRRWGQKESTL